MAQRATVAMLAGIVFAVSLPAGAWARNAYVSNFGSDNVTAFDINAQTGALTQVGGSPFATGGTALKGVAITPDGRRAYVPNQGSDNVTAFDINSSTGALTQVAGSPFAAGGTAPDGLAISPDGRRVYTPNYTSDTVTAFDIDSSTGALTHVSGSPFAAGGTGPNGVAVSPDGRRAYVPNYDSNDVTAFDIDSSTGALTQVAGSPFAAGTAPYGVAISPDGGRAYVSNFGSDNVTAFDINAQTGALTQVGGSPFAAGTGPVGVAISPDGGRAYVSNFGSDNVTAFDINAQTGALTQVAGSPFATGGTVPDFQSVAIVPAQNGVECDPNAVFTGNVVFTGQTALCNGRPAPVNTALPEITGTPTVGSALTCSTGTWTNSPTSYAYQWKRGGTDIAGATSATYALTSADAATTVTCQVTASNVAGPGTPATSAGVSVATLAAIAAKNGKKKQWIAKNGKLKLKATSPFDGKVKVFARVGYDPAAAAGLTRRKGCRGIVWGKPKTRTVKAGKRRNVTVRLSKGQLLKLGRAQNCTKPKARAGKASSKRPYMPAVVRARFTNASGSQAAKARVELKLKAARSLRRWARRQG